MINWIYSNNIDNTARYTLGKSGARILVCIGINPSIATPVQLDPTLKKVERIALRNHYDGWIMLNVYPQRATDPNDIHELINDELHQENINAIRHALNLFSVNDIWAAWGDDIKRRPFLRDCLRDLVPIIGEEKNWISMGTLTVKQNPRHPLYISESTPFNRLDIQNYLIQ